MDRPLNRRDWRRDPERRARLLAGAFLLLVIVIIGVIVFRPHPPDPSGEAGLALWLNQAHRHGLPRWIGFDLIEFTSNVVMFAPLGFLGALVLVRNSWLVVVIGLLGAGTIEFAQHLLLPGRVSSLNDVLANTLGALIGYLIALPIVTRRSRRRSRAARGVRGARDRQPVSA